MKANQKSITISNLNNNDIQQLKNYLNISNESQNETFKTILRLGIQVVNGEYHDKELANINLQLQNLNTTGKTIIGSQNLISEGLSDIQDAITDNKTDSDLIIEPSTKHNQK